MLVAPFPSPEVKSQHMLLHRPFSVLLSVLASLALAGAALAADLTALVGNLTSGGLCEREAAITALATSGDERAAPILATKRNASKHIAPHRMPTGIGRDVTLENREAACGDCDWCTTHGYRAR